MRDERERIPARCPRIYSALIPRVVALSGSSFLSSTLFSLFTEAGCRDRGGPGAEPCALLAREKWGLRRHSPPVRRHCSLVHADGVHVSLSCNQPFQEPQFLRKEKSKSSSNSNWVNLQKKNVSKQQFANLYLLSEVLGVFSFLSSLSSPLSDSLTISLFGLISPAL